MDAEQYRIARAGLVIGARYVRSSLFNTEGDLAIEHLDHIVAAMIVIRKLRHKGS